MKDLHLLQHDRSGEVMDVICIVKRNRHMSAIVNRLLAILTVLFCAVWMVQAGNSQTTFGSVVGSVTDSSGAVLAGASVTLTSVGTGEVHKMTANSGGVYSFVDLQPGIYKLDVDNPGFKHISINQIEVQVGSTTRANAVLQVGNVSQTVEVTSTAPLIETDSANLGGVIEGRTVQTIPLNGRNVNNLLELVPGVQAGGSTSGNLSTNEIAYGNYQIGGGFGNQSSFYIDGVLSNMPSNNALALIPSQDTVREFQVTTSDVSAEFGGFAGGIVNISTKAGTNAFHGTAYEYMRARVLNANDFFSNRLGRVRPSWIQNQFGATVGGPIIRNKAFFFGAFEREPVVNASQPGQSTLPTSAELGISGVAACPGCADFSAVGLPTIYDPTTGQQFQCNGVLNVICANRIDPAVAAILKQDYPTTLIGGSPISALSNNWIAVTRAHYLLSTYNARVDYNINSKNILFGRYTQFLDQSQSTTAYPGVSAYKVAGPAGISDKQVIIGDTHTLNPTTVLDGRLSYLRAYQFQPPRGLGTDISGLSSGLAAAQTALGEDLPVSLSFSGTPITGGTPPGQLFWYENMYMASGSITKILGRHTVKAGGNIRQVEWIAKPDSGGIVNVFTSRVTALNGTTGGYPLASAMLGVPESTNAQAIGGSRSFLHSYGFYLTDKFQVSQKLTADLGVRWDQPGSYSEVNNWNTVILPKAPSPLGTIYNSQLAANQALQGAIALVATSQYPDRREEQLHWKLFAPRVGLAYRLSNNTVLRSGYGISYLPSTLSQDGPNSASVNTERTTLTNIDQTPGPGGGQSTTGFSTTNTTVLNPFPSGVLTPSRNNPAGLAVLYGQNIQARDPYQKYSYMQQWNLALEHQFGGSASLSIAYGGAKGTHLQAQGANTWSAANANQIPDSDLALGTAALETQVPNPFYGVAQAGPLGQQPTILSGKLLMPYPQFGYVTLAGSRNSASEYSSLQIGYKERFAHEGILSVAYTWSSLMSNTDTITQFLEGGDSYAGTVQDNNNLHNEWSKSSSDFPSNLTVGYGVDVPVGKGEKFLSNVQGPAAIVASGWRVNGVTTFRSGQPIGLLANESDVAKYFGGGGYYQNGIGDGTTRPNQMGGCDPNPRMSNLARVNAGEWFNQSCFTQPAALGFGNEPRLDPNLRRDGIKNFDFSVLKATHIRENLTFNFTAEFYNLFNRVQFAAPSSAFYDGANFGKITSQYNNPRQIQFGGRFEF
jgi:hypothetical protein